MAKKAKKPKHGTGADDGRREVIIRTGSAHGPTLTRREFIQLAGLALGGAALACNQGGQQTTTEPPTTGGGVTGATTPPESTATSEIEGTPLPEADVRPVITFNDYVPEQLNVIDTVVVLVNYSDLPERVFNLGQYWDRIFGLDDPIRQLNAYYHANFYDQLEMQPVVAEGMTDPGYVEVVFEGSPEDYTIGWLIGLEHASMEEVDPEAVQRVILQTMAYTVAAQPGIDYQDKFIFVVLNAAGREYGRGAMGALPTGGPQPSVSDLFIGDVTEEERVLFADEAIFQIVETADGPKVIGVISPYAYTFADYFRDRADHVQDDQFILGMAIFGTEAPLSCACHDILHGFRRKSASANPPEGRTRAADCLYNLPLQSLWVVGTEEHGGFDRSINCSPYIGWWDPMGDHLHTAGVREFFESHPHGMCSFTKLKMGLIPERCIAAVNEDDGTLRLAPLSNPQLPAPGSAVETMVIKVPLDPTLPALRDIYLLLEYRRRVGSDTGTSSPDNFTIPVDFIYGDPTFDPGYNAADPAASVYVNPPLQFCPSEGVLVYVVNEGIPHVAAAPYTQWYNFPVALLNPAGNDQRENLNEAALDAGEFIEVDFSNFYADRNVGLPVRIRVEVTERTDDYAEVHITRERL